MAEASSGPLSSGDAGNGQVPAAVPPAAGGAPPAAAPVAPEQPAVVFNTNEQFNERMDRHYRSRMREQFGTDDPAEIKAIIAKAKELEDAEAERAKAEMTEVDRLKAELVEREAEKAAAEEQADIALFESHVTGKCAALGIKNTDYAMFQVAQAAEALPDDQELDVEAYLKTQMEEHPDVRAAYGMEAPVEGVPVPAHTTPHNPNTPGPVTPPAGGPPPAVRNANDMTPQEFQKHLASLGAS